MPKQQSQLEKQRSRAETLTRFAIKQHNRRARDLKSQRVKSEKKAEEMVARQEERYRNYLKAQQINANSGGGMAGAMQGGMTGASLGGMVGGPWGALAGGLIGAAGGGLYGASEGRQAVAQLAPYAAGISQVAGGISQMQANKERTAAMGQMYGQRGGGFGGQPAGFGAPQWSGPQWDDPIPTAGGVSLTGGQGGSQSGMVQPKAKVFGSVAEQNETPTHLYDRLDYSFTEPGYAGISQSWRR